MSTQFAVIFDFDDTLAEDSTAALVTHYKTPALTNYYAEKLRDIYDNDESKVAQCFFDEATEMVSEGWDPSLAYTSLLVDKIRQGYLPPLTRADLESFGKNHVTIYPGVRRFLADLRKQFIEDSVIAKEHFSLDYYVVSGGIGDIIRGSPIAGEFRDIWACEFQFDEGGVPVRPKSVITFTEKTKCLFCINKGIERAQSLQTPYAVNADMPESDRPIPLSHMIYVGDGPSDIPCMSLLKKVHGEAFLLYGPKTVHKAWEIGDRGHHCPRDYEKWGRQYMIAGILSHARAIAAERAKARAVRLTKDVGYSTKPSSNKKHVGHSAKPSSNKKHVNHGAKPSSNKKSRK
jgi:hypothetical protein